MKHFTSVQDAGDVSALISEALQIKSNPEAYGESGRHKTLGLVFMNPSLRTRMSTQKAARLLGMDVIVLSADSDSWKLEFQDGAVMNGAGVEHIRDAAAVMGLYCDVIGLRCFPALKDRAQDYGEAILESFKHYCRRPVLSLESATRHPLQSLSDLISIQELMPEGRPKVLLNWAPHIKPLPQAVANSFSEWMLAWDRADFYIACPEAYKLSPEFTRGATWIHSPDALTETPDFIYYKNWSSFEAYGQMPDPGGNWYPDASNGFRQAAYTMHCLPVRRNVEVPDALLDSPRSAVLRQAENRVYAAAAALRKLISE